MICPDFGLARHAIGGVHGGAEHVPVLEHHRPVSGSRREWRPDCPSTLSWGWAEICCCIWAAALSASSAVGKVDITSSPIVLMTVPWCWSVALRMHFDADGDHVSRTKVAHQLVEPG